jgi:hypothetical protein
MSCDKEPFQSCLGPQPQEPADWYVPSPTTGVGRIRVVLCSLTGGLGGRGCAQRLPPPTAAGDR